MTARRYDAYRRVHHQLELLAGGTLAEAERDLLRDAAEGLLLARDGEENEIDELRGRVAMALALLVDLGRWSDGAADELWERVVACGPYDTASGARARKLRVLPV